MKYLVRCSSCGTKTAVETGQAGQTLRCNCGASLEVPSIRGMRELETVADEKSAAPSWSTRQGLAFLGGAIAGLALVAAGGVWLVRPPAKEESVLLDVDGQAIHREVTALSITDGFVRFQLLDRPTSKSMSERLKNNEVPVHLLPSANLLVAFEGKGPEALAPEAAKKVLQQAAKLDNEAFGRAKQRLAIDFWLWLIAGIGGCGILIACSALVVLAVRGRTVDGNRHVLRRKTIVVERRKRYPAKLHRAA